MSGQTAAGAGTHRCDDRAMTEIRTAHTGDLDPATLAAAHGLMEEVFEDGLDPHDWEHALGGIHALAWEDGALVGHASLIQRRLLHGGRALRAGYVEAVGVRASVRRRGHGGAMMAELERLIRGAYDLGALGATDHAAAFYAARAWRVWHGPTSALTLDGVKRTAAEDGGIFVLPAAATLDLAGELTCDWRDGDLW
jgi:aminoglycoside 2'-N-acetyltransferase I